MKKIRYLDMFAGVGGFRTGLTNAGDFFVSVGWCEIDPFAQKAYRALYETEGEYFCDDATRIKCEDLPEIDLITAGFPCQPFSVSGRRLGFADTRGTLFHEIVRVAEARRPAYLLLENVPGLLNHEGGKTFGTILTAIHELGYSLEWCVLNSTHFGVPQQRRRVYIVGYLDSRLSGKIFPLATGNGTTLKQVIPGGQGQRVYSPEGASTCLTSQGGGWGAKTGLYFVDMNADPKVTHEARCITARQDSGISNRKGEHSGVIITGARAVLTPER
ncbi:MAG: DNA (cytosine-5-)-methyltransferase, partial [Ruminococcaceae bacterium]|nr:DNA (cytosine-5-)-methyltransferase [Oscillospiraceae bacterium]